MNVSLKKETCSFFGHRQLYKEEQIRERLKFTVLKKFEEGYNHFYMGNHGEFDRLALSVCIQLRKEYINIKITVIVTFSIFKRKLIYKNNKIAEWKKIFITDKEEMYKSVAEELYEDVETLTYNIEEEHFKRQITQTNRYIVDDSDCTIGYINPEQKQNGAKNALNYAIKQGKETINIYSEIDHIQYGKTPKQRQKN